MLLNKIDGYEIIKEKRGKRKKDDKDSRVLFYIYLRTTN